MVLVEGFPSDYARQDLVVEDNNGVPVTKFVNVAFESVLGVVLLENPVGRNAVRTCGELAAKAADIFEQVRKPEYDPEFLAGKLNFEFLCAGIS